jgi:hypothetical protein
MFLFLTTLPCDVAEKLEQACISKKDADFGAGDYCTILYYLPGSRKVVL